MKEQIVYSSSENDFKNKKRVHGLSHATADKIYKIDNPFSKFCDQIMHDKDLFGESVQKNEEKLMCEWRQDIDENVKCGVLNRMKTMRSSKDAKAGSI